MSYVEENLGEGRFELWIDESNEVAVAYYCMDDSRYILTHTVVPDPHSEKNIGSQLACGVFDEIRARGRKAILICPFMISFYELHPEYWDVVEGTVDPTKKS